MRRRNYRLIYSIDAAIYRHIKEYCQMVLKGYDEKMVLQKRMFKLFKKITVKFYKNTVNR